MGDSGSMLIGLVLVGERDHPDRPVLRRPTSARARWARRRAWLPTFCRWPLPITLLVVPIADLVLAVDPPHPGRAVTVRPRQAAPAPPAPRDRALPAPGGADHVDVGRPGRRHHRRGQPLHRPADVVGGSRPRRPLVTVALTFVLPRGPPAPCGHDASERGRLTCALTSPAGPGWRPPIACATFHKHPELPPPIQKRPPPT